VDPSLAPHLAKRASCQHVPPPASHLPATCLPTPDSTCHLLLLPAAQRRALLHALATEAFSSPNIWLVLETEVEPVSEDRVYFPIDSQVFTFVEDPVSRHIHISEVYKTSNNSPTLTLQYGNWFKEGDSAGRLNVSQAPLPERRKDLQGHVFQAQTLPFMPFVYVNMSALQNGNVNQIEGIVGDIWHKVLEKELNFSTQFSSPADGQWGAPGPLPPGNQSRDGAFSDWTGIIGDLLSGSADVGVTGFYFTAERGQVVRFSPSFMESTSR
jgi:hypothetical protein